MHPQARRQHSFLLPVALRFRRILRIAIVALILVAALTGSAQPPGVVAALEALSNSPSYEFVESGSSFIVPHASDFIYEVTGSYQSPDRLWKRTSVRSTWGEGNTTVQSVRVGNAQYLLDPVSEEWITYHKGQEGNSNTSMESSLFINPADTLADVIAQAGQFKSKGVYSLDDVRVRHFEWSTPNFWGEVCNGQAGKVDIDLFIGVEDSLVRKLAISSSWHFWTPILRPLQEQCADADLEWSIVESQYTLEFSFLSSGDETLIVAPPTDRDIVFSEVGPMALFTNSLVPLSFRYPAEWKRDMSSLLFSNDIAWKDISFTDMEAPESWPRRFQISIDFMDDAKLKERYRHLCYEGDPHETYVPLCTVVKRIDSLHAERTFTAEDHVDLRMVQSTRNRQPLWRQRSGDGNGWSAEVSEWVSLSDFFPGTYPRRYGHTRELTYLHTVASDHPRCFPGSSLCYVLIRFAYTDWTEELLETRALADYSFSTLEWDGMTLGQEGEQP